MNESFYGFGPSDDKARAYRPGGLPGATALSRLAGATSSGTPTVGAFRKGDLLVGQDGTLRVCTVGGNPGTWVQLGTLVDPLTARGDLIVRGASSTTRLALGSNNQVLTSNGTDAVWAASPAGAGGALTQIAQTVLSSSAASITFSSIPGTYSTLELVIDARIDAASANMRVQVNGDTGANYDWTLIESNGSLATSTDSLATTFIRIGDAAGTDAPAGVSAGFRLTIPNYAGTTFHKTLLALSTYKLANSTSNIHSTFWSGFWRSTSALTSIKLFPASGNMIAGSVATVYGIS